MIAGDRKIKINAKGSHEWFSWMEIKLQNPWFYFILWPLVGVILLFSYFVLRHFVSLLGIAPDENTDYPVLLSAILTIVIAAFTLLVSWYIKEEAEEIGDNIITSTVIHRHLDRMLHEYSQIITESYEKAQTEKYPFFYFKIDFILKSSEWFAKNHLKEMDNKFFASLMPGIAGNRFSSMLGFDGLLKTLSTNISNEESLLKFKKNKETILLSHQIYLKTAELIIHLSDDQGLSDGDGYSAIANFDYPRKDSNEAQDYDYYDEPDYPPEDCEPPDPTEQEISQWKMAKKMLESDISKLKDKLDNKKTSSEYAWIKNPRTIDEIYPFGHRLREAKKFYENQLSEFEDRAREDAFTYIEELKHIISLIDEYLNYLNEIENLGDNIQKLTIDVHSSGAAIHRIMQALGWHLPIANRNIEDMAEKIYSTESKLEMANQGKN